jgi:putative ABC transport system ATP-binding protein
MDTIIVGEHIVKSFGVGRERRHVLDDVSVEIDAGEFVAIMGPSGSGKTTLLFALSGMDSVDAGRITFDGVELSRLSDKALADVRRTKMGFVFQQPTLLKNLNVFDNVILPSVRDGRKTAEQIATRARSLMKMTGIEELETRGVAQASGGQLQRVGICRALMGEPKVIFGDEPTGALNSTSSNEIMALLAEVHRTGTTIVLVTHDVEVATRAERVLFIFDGKITGAHRAGRWDGSGHDLKARKAALVDWLAEMGF